MPKMVWRSSMLLDIYDMAREGLNDMQIAKTLGVSKEIFKIWKKKKLRVKRALARGRGKTLDTQSQPESMAEYVYRRMPERFKALYDELRRWEKDPNFQKRCDALFANQGKDVRQHLFLEFLITKNFNGSDACRAVGISKRTLDHWIRNDPRFAELYEEMSWHKKNVLDGAFWKLVKKGSEGAILAGQRTLNADRGFQPITKMSVDGKVDHQHDHDVRIETLPLELRKKLLKAIESGQEAKLALEDIPDAEIVEKT